MLRQANLVVREENNPGAVLPYGGLLHALVHQAGDQVRRTMNIGSEVDVSVDAVRDRLVQEFRRLRSDGTYGESLPDGWGQPLTDREGRRVSADQIAEQLERGGSSWELTEFVPRLISDVFDVRVTVFLDEELVAEGTAARQQVGDPAALPEVMVMRVARPAGRVVEVEAAGGGASAADAAASAGDAELVMPPGLWPAAHTHGRQANPSSHDMIAAHEEPVNEQPQIFTVEVESTASTDDLGDIPDQPVGNVDVLAQPMEPTGARDQILSRARRDLPQMVRPPDGTALREAIVRAGAVTRAERAFIDVEFSDENLQAMFSRSLETGQWAKLPRGSTTMIGVRIVKIDPVRVEPVNPDRADLSSTARRGQETVRSSGTSRPPAGPAEIPVPTPVGTVVFTMAGLVNDRSSSMEAFRSSQHTTTATEPGAPAIEGEYRVRYQVDVSGGLGNPTTSQVDLNMTLRWPLRTATEQENTLAQPGSSIGHARIAGAGKIYRNVLERLKGRPADPTTGEFRDWLNDVFDNHAVELLAGHAARRGFRFGRRNESVDVEISLVRNTTDARMESSSPEGVVQRRETAAGGVSIAQSVKRSWGPKTFQFMVGLPAFGAGPMFGYVRSSRITAGTSGGHTHEVASTYTGPLQRYTEPVRLMVKLHRARERLTAPFPGEVTAFLRPAPVVDHPYDESVPADDTGRTNAEQRLRAIGSQVLDRLLSRYRFTPASEAEIVRQVMERLAAHVTDSNRFTTETALRQFVRDYARHIVNGVDDLRMPLSELDSALPDLTFRGVANRDDAAYQGVVRDEKLAVAIGASGGHTVTKQTSKKTTGGAAAYLALSNPAPWPNVGINRATGDRVTDSRQAGQEQKLAGDVLHRWAYPTHVRIEIADGRPVTDPPVTARTTVEVDAPARPGEDIHALASIVRRRSIDPTSEWDPDRTTPGWTRTRPTTDWPVSVGTDTRPVPDGQREGFLPAEFELESAKPIPTLHTTAVELLRLPKNAFAWLKRPWVGKDSTRFDKPGSARLALETFTNFRAQVARFWTSVVLGTSVSVENHNSGGLLGARNQTGRLGLRTQLAGARIELSEDRHVFSTGSHSSTGHGSVHGKGTSVSAAAELGNSFNIGRPAFRPGIFVAGDGEIGRSREWQHSQATQHTTDTSYTTRGYLVTFDANHELTTSARRNWWDGIGFQHPGKPITHQRWIHVPAAYSLWVPAGEIHRIGLLDPDDVGKLAPSDRENYLRAARWYGQEGLPQQDIAPTENSSSGDITAGQATSPGQPTAEAPVASTSAVPPNIQPPPGIGVNSGTVELFNTRALEELVTEIQSRLATHQLAVTPGGVGSQAFDSVARAIREALGRADPTARQFAEINQQTVPEFLRAELANDRGAVVGRLMREWVPIYVPEPTAFGKREQLVLLRATLDDGTYHDVVPGRNLRSSWSRNRAAGQAGQRELAGGLGVGAFGRLFGSAPVASRLESDFGIAGAMGDSWETSTGRERSGSTVTPADQQDVRFTHDMRVTMEVYPYAAAGTYRRLVGEVLPGFRPSMTSTPWSDQIDLPNAVRSRIPLSEAVVGPAASARPPMDAMPGSLRRWQEQHALRLGLTGDADIVARPYAANRLFETLRVLAEEPRSTRAGDQQPTPLRPSAFRQLVAATSWRRLDLRKAMSKTGYQVPLTGGRVPKVTIKVDLRDRELIEVLPDQSPQPESGTKNAALDNSRGHKLNAALYTDLRLPTIGSSQLRPGASQGAGQVPWLLDSSHADKSETHSHVRSGQAAEASRRYLVRATPVWEVTPTYRKGTPRHWTVPRHSEADEPILLEVDYRGLRQLGLHEPQPTQLPSARQPISPTINTKDEPVKAESRSEDGALVPDRGQPTEASGVADQPSTSAAVVTTAVATEEAQGSTTVSAPVRADAPPGGEVRLSDGRRFAQRNVAYDGNCLFAAIVNSAWYQDDDRNGVLAQLARIVGERPVQPDPTVLNSLRDEVATRFEGESDQLLSNTFGSNYESLLATMFVGDLGPAGIKRAKSERDVLANELASNPEMMFGEILKLYQQDMTVRRMSELIAEITRNGPLTRLPTMAEIFDLVLREERFWNTDFGDSVPSMLPWLLDIQLTIVEDGNTLHVLNPGDRPNITVLRANRHYLALEPLSVSASASSSNTVHPSANFDTVPSPATSEPSPAAPPPVIMVNGVVVEPPGPDVTPESAAARLLPPWFAERGALGDGRVAQGLRLTEADLDRVVNQALLDMPADKARDEALSRVKQLFAGARPAAVEQSDSGRALWSKLLAGNVFTAGERLVQVFVTLDVNGAREVEPTEADAIEGPSRYRSEYGDTSASKTAVRSRRDDSSALADGTVNLLTAGALSHVAPALRIESDRDHSHHETIATEIQSGNRSIVPDEALFAAGARLRIVVDGVETGDVRLPGDLRVAFPLAFCRQAADSSPAAAEPVWVPVTDPAALHMTDEVVNAASVDGLLEKIDERLAAQGVSLNKRHALLAQMTKESFNEKVFKDRNPWWKTGSWVTKVFRARRTNLYFKVGGTLKLLAAEGVSTAPIREDVADTGGIKDGSSHSSGVSIQGGTEFGIPFSEVHLATPGGSLGFSSQTTDSRSVTSQSQAKFATMHNGEQARYRTIVELTLTPITPKPGFAPFTHRVAAEVGVPLAHAREFELAATGQVVTSTLRTDADPPIRSDVPTGSATVTRSARPHGSSVARRGRRGAPLGRSTGFGARPFSRRGWPVGKTTASLLHAARRGPIEVEVSPGLDLGAGQWPKVADHPNVTVVRPGERTAVRAPEVPVFRYVVAADGGVEAAYRIAAEPAPGTLPGPAEVLDADTLEKFGQDDSAARLQYAFAAVNAYAQAHNQPVQVQIETDLSDTTVLDTTVVDKVAAARDEFLSNGLVRVNGSHLTVDDEPWPLAHFVIDKRGVLTGPFGINTAVERVRNPARPVTAAPVASPPLNWTADDSGIADLAQFIEQNGNIQLQDQRVAAAQDSTVGLIADRRVQAINRDGTFVDIGRDDQGQLVVRPIQRATPAWSLFVIQADSTIKGPLPVLPARYPQGTPQPAAIAARVGGGPGAVRVLAGAEQLYPLARQTIIDMLADVYHQADVKNRHALDHRLAMFAGVPNVRAKFPSIVDGGVEFHETFGGYVIDGQLRATLGGLLDEGEDHRVNVDKQAKNMIAVDMTRTKETSVTGSLSAKLRLRAGGAASVDVDLAEVKGKRTWSSGRTSSVGVKTYRRETTTGDVRHYDLDTVYTLWFVLRRTPEGAPVSKRVRELSNEPGRPPTYWTRHVVSQEHVPERPVEPAKLDRLGTSTLLMPPPTMRSGDRLAAWRDTALRTVLPGPAHAAPVMIPLATHGVPGFQPRFVGVKHLTDGVLSLLGEDEDAVADLDAAHTGFDIAGNRLGAAEQVLTMLNPGSLTSNFESLVNGRYIVPLPDKNGRKRAVVIAATAYNPEYERHSDNTGTEDYVEADNRFAQAKGKENHGSVSGGVGVVGTLGAGHNAGEGASRGQGGATQRKTGNQVQAGGKAAGGIARTTFHDERAGSLDLSSVTYTKRTHQVLADMWYEAALHEWSEDRFRRRRSPTQQTVYVPVAGGLELSIPHRRALDYAGLVPDHAHPAATGQVTVPSQHMLPDLPPRFAHIERLYGAEQVLSGIEEMMVDAHLLPEDMRGVPTNMWRGIMSSYSTEVLRNQSGALTSTGVPHVINIPTSYGIRRVAFLVKAEVGSGAFVEDRPDARVTSGGQAFYQSSSGTVKSSELEARFNADGRGRVGQQDSLTGGIEVAYRTEKAQRDAEVEMLRDIRRAISEDPSVEFRHPMTFKIEMYLETELLELLNKVGQALYLPVTAVDSLTGDAASALIGRLFPDHVTPHATKQVRDVTAHVLVPRSLTSQTPVTLAPSEPTPTFVPKTVTEPAPLNELLSPVVQVVTLRNLDSLASWAPQVTLLRPEVRLPASFRPGGGDWLAGTARFNEATMRNSMGALLGHEYEIPFTNGPVTVALDVNQAHWLASGGFVGRNFPERAVEPESESETASGWAVKPDAEFGHLVEIDQVNLELAHDVNWLHRAVTAAMTGDWREQNRKQRGQFHVYLMDVTYTMAGRSGKALRVDIPLGLVGLVHADDVERIANAHPDLFPPGPPPNVAAQPEPTTTSDNPAGQEPVSESPKPPDSVTDNVPTDALDQSSSGNQAEESEALSATVVEPEVGASQDESSQSTVEKGPPAGAQTFATGHFQDGATSLPPATRAMFKKLIDTAIGWALRRHRARHLLGEPKLTISALVSGNNDEAHAQRIAALSYWIENELVQRFGQHATEDQRGRPVTDFVEVTPVATMKGDSGKFEMWLGRPLGTLEFTSQGPYSLQLPPDQLPALDSAVHKAVAAWWRYFWEKRQSPNRPHFFVLGPSQDVIDRRTEILKKEIRELLVKEATGIREDVPKWENWLLEDYAATWSWHGVIRADVNSVHISMGANYADLSLSEPVPMQNVPEQVRRVWHQPRDPAEAPDTTYRPPEVSLRFSESDIELTADHKNLLNRLVWDVADAIDSRADAGRRMPGIQIFVPNSPHALLNAGQRAERVKAYLAQFLTAKRSFPVILAPHVAPDAVEVVVDWTVGTAPPVELPPSYVRLDFRDGRQVIPDHRIRTLDKVAVEVRARLDRQLGLPQVEIRAKADADAQIAQELLSRSLGSRGVQTNGPGGVQVITESDDRLKLGDVDIYIDWHAGQSNVLESSDAEFPILKTSPGDKIANNPELPSSNEYARNYSKSEWFTKSIAPIPATVEQVRAHLDDLSRAHTTRVVYEYPDVSRNTEVVPRHSAPPNVHIIQTSGIVDFDHAEIITEAGGAAHVFTIRHHIPKPDWMGSDAYNSLIAKITQSVDRYFNQNYYFPDGKLIYVRVVLVDDPSESGHIPIDIVDTGSFTQYTIPVNPPAAQAEYEEFSLVHELAGHFLGFFDAYHIGGDPLSRIFLYPRRGGRNHLRWEPGLMSTPIGPFAASEAILLYRIVRDSTMTPVTDYRPLPEQSIAPLRYGPSSYVTGADLQGGNTAQQPYPTDARPFGGRAERLPGPLNLLRQALFESDPGRDWSDVLDRFKGWSPEQLAQLFHPTGMLRPTVLASTIDPVPVATAPVRPTTHTAVADPPAQQSASASAEAGWSAARWNRDTHEVVLPDGTRLVEENVNPDGDCFFAALINGATYQSVGNEQSPGSVISWLASLATVLDERTLGQPSSQAVGIVRKSLTDAFDKTQDDRSDRLPDDIAKLFVNDLPSDALKGLLRWVDPNWTAPTPDLAWKNARLRKNQSKQLMARVHGASYSGGGVAWSQAKDDITMLPARAIDALYGEVPEFGHEDQIDWLGSAEDVLRDTIADQLGASPVIWFGRIRDAYQTFGYDEMATLMDNVAQIVLENNALPTSRQMIKTVLRDNSVWNTPFADNLTAHVAHLAGIELVVVQNGAAPTVLNEDGGPRLYVLREYNHYRALIPAHLRPPVGQGVSSRHARPAEPESGPSRKRPRVETPVTGRDFRPATNTTDDPKTLSRQPSLTTGFGSLNISTTTTMNVDSDGPSRVEKQDDGWTAIGPYGWKARLAVGTDKPVRMSLKDYLRDLVAKNKLEMSKVQGIVKEWALEALHNSAPKPGVLTVGKMAGVSGSAVQKWRDAGTRQTSSPSRFEGGERQATVEVDRSGRVRYRDWTFMLGRRWVGRRVRVVESMSSAESDVPGRLGVIFTWADNPSQHLAVPIVEDGLTAGDQGVATVQARRGYYFNSMPKFGVGWVDGETIVINGNYLRAQWFMDSASAANPIVWFVRQEMKIRLFSMDWFPIGLVDLNSVKFDPASAGHPRKDYTRQRPFERSELAPLWSGSPAAHTGAIRLYGRVFYLPREAVGKPVVPEADQVLVGRLRERGLASLRIEGEPDTRMIFALPTDGGPAVYVENARPLAMIGDTASGTSFDGVGDDARGLDVPSATDSAVRVEPPGEPAEESADQYLSGDEVASGDLVKRRRFKTEVIRQMPVGPKEHRRHIIPSHLFSELLNAWWRHWGGGADVAKQLRWWQDRLDNFMENLWVGDGEANTVAGGLANELNKARSLITERMVGRDALATIHSLFDQAERAAVLAGNKHVWKPELQREWVEGPTRAMLDPEAGGTAVVDFVNLLSKVLDLRDSAEFDWPGGTATEYHAWIEKYYKFRHVAERPDVYEWDKLNDELRDFMRLRGPAGRPVGRKRGGVAQDALGSGDMWIPRVWRREKFNEDVQSALPVGDGQQRRHIVPSHLARLALNRWMSHHRREVDASFVRDMQRIQDKFDNFTPNLWVGDTAGNMAAGGIARLLRTAAKRVTNDMTHDDALRAVTDVFTEALAEADRDGAAVRRLAEQWERLREPASGLLVAPADDPGLTEFCAQWVYLMDLHDSADFDWPGGTPEEFRAWIAAYYMFTDIARRPDTYSRETLYESLNRFFTLLPPRGGSRMPRAGSPASAVTSASGSYRGRRTAAQVADFVDRQGIRTVGGGVPLAGRFTLAPDPTAKSGSNAASHGRALRVAPLAIVGGEQDQKAARLGVRFERESDGSRPRLVFHLRLPNDPDRVYPLSWVWQHSAEVSRLLGGSVEADLPRLLRRVSDSWPVLKRLLAQEQPTELALTPNEAGELLDRGTMAFQRAGFEVFWPSDMVRGQLRLRLSSRAGVSGGLAGLFGSSVVVTSVSDDPAASGVADVELTEKEWRALLGARPDSLVALRGRWVRADAALVQRLRELEQDPLTAERNLLMQALATEIGAGDRLYNRPLLVSPPRELRRLVEALANNTGGTIDTVPGFGGHGPARMALLPHQQRGVYWLVTRAQLDLGAVFADPMGLGKTAQIIATHLYLHASSAGSPNPAGAEFGPTLVVVPSMLVSVWQRELRTFAPDVQVVVYRVDKRGQLPSLANLRADAVVLTTYHEAFQDRYTDTEVAGEGPLARQRWGLVVADEAHHAKNPASKNAHALRAVARRSRSRIAVTATPLQNGVVDLWSLLDWTNSGLLGTHAEFVKLVNNPTKNDPDALNRALHRIAAAFVLRRAKSDIVNLPPKYEEIIEVELSSVQRSRYDREYQNFRNPPGDTFLESRPRRILKLISRLKTLVNHPDHPVGSVQLPANLRATPGQSGKLDEVDRLVTSIDRDRDPAMPAPAVLVFSQYNATLDIIAARLRSGGIKPLMLDGRLAIQVREDAVQTFEGLPRESDQPIQVMLVSLQSGGEGITLLRATHVIHFDHWWNPAVVNQATGRAHRIGQRHPVRVYHLITRGTVEQHIRQILQTKQALVDNILPTSLDAPGPFGAPPTITIDATIDATDKDNPDQEILRHIAAATDDQLDALLAGTVPTEEADIASADVDMDGQRNQLWPGTTVPVPALPPANFGAVPGFGDGVASTVGSAGGVVAAPHAEIRKAPVRRFRAKIDDVVTALRSLATMAAEWWIHTSQIDAVRTAGDNQVFLLTTQVDSELLWEARLTALIKAVAVVRALGGQVLDSPRLRQAVVQAGRHVEEVRHKLEDVLDWQGDWAEVLTGAWLGHAVTGGSVRLGLDALLSNAQTLAVHQTVADALSGRTEWVQRWVGQVWTAMTAEDYPRLAEIEQQLWAMARQDELLDASRLIAEQETSSEARQARQLEIEAAVRQAVRNLGRRPVDGPWSLPVPREATPGQGVPVAGGVYFPPFRDSGAQWSQETVDEWIGVSSFPVIPDVFTVFAHRDPLADRIAAGDGFVDFAEFARRVMSAYRQAVAEGVIKHGAMVLLLACGSARLINAGADGRDLAERIRDLLVVAVMAPRGILWQVEDGARIGAWGLNGQDRPETGPPTRHELDTGVFPPSEDQLYYYPADGTPRQAKGFDLPKALAGLHVPPEALAPFEGQWLANRVAWLSVPGGVVEDTDS